MGRRVVCDLLRIMVVVMVVVVVMGKMRKEFIHDIFFWSARDLPSVAD